VPAASVWAIGLGNTSKSESKGDGFEHGKVLLLKTQEF
jgi:hypothetical protein